MTEQFSIHMWSPTAVYFVIHIEQTFHLTVTLPININGKVRWQSLTCSTYFSED